MKLGDHVQIKTGCCQNYTEGQIVEEQPDRSLYKLRFEDGVEMWFLRRELVRA